mgnify:CR=1 FL=1
MPKDQNQNLIVFFNIMSKKGFYKILLYVESHENIHYNEILKDAMKNNIVGSRASITIILNNLTDLGLLRRIVSQNRPIRTTYKVTNKGKIIIKNMKELQNNLFKEL